MDNLQLDINQTTPVVCESCGGIYFDQALILRKASGILTGTGKDSYLPIPVFKCTSCGHVNEAFQPKEGQSLD